MIVALLVVRAAYAARWISPSIVVVGVGRRCALAAARAAADGVPSARPAALPARPRLSARATRRCATSVPAFVSRGVVQISGFIDIALASSIADVGAVALLANAQTIYLLPISLFGMSVSAAELPEMSRDTGAGAAAFERLRARLDAALPRVAFFVVPSARRLPRARRCDRRRPARGRALHARRTACARGPSSPAPPSDSSRARWAGSTRPPSTRCATRERRSGSPSCASC